ncbi:Hypothetical predicted protein, partial [Marmota monax]
ALGRSHACVPVRAVLPVRNVAVSSLEEAQIHLTGLPGAAFPAVGSLSPQHTVQEVRSLAREERPPGSPGRAGWPRGQESGSEESKPCIFLELPL